MVFSGMLRRVVLVRADVSEELGSSETSVLTRATWRNIPEDTILHSHRRENLKSYKGEGVLGAPLPAYKQRNRISYYPHPFPPVSLFTQRRMSPSTHRPTHPRLHQPLNKMTKSSTAETALISTSASAADNAISVQ
jgi:hypothetical protein